MPTVKVLSPEMTALERADGIKTPAGNSATGAKASRLCPPGIEGRFERDSKTSGVKNVGSILNAVRLSSFALSLSKGDWASTSSHARQQILRPT